MHTEPLSLIHNSERNAKQQLGSSEFSLVVFNGTVHTKTKSTYSIVLKCSFSLSAENTIIMNEQEFF